MIQQKLERVLINCCIIKWWQVYYMDTNVGKYYHGATVRITSAFEFKETLCKYAYPIAQVEF